MQTIKKSKIFLNILFLVALLFVSCSFEDTLGTNGSNTVSGGSSGGGNGGSEENNGFSIPKTYYGKYTKVGNRDTAYITVGNDSNGDYILLDGGNKEYVKDLVYAGENTWKQLISNNGYYSETWQYTLKTENNRRIFLFTCINTYIPKGYSSTNYQYRYIHDKDK